MSSIEWTDVTWNPVSGCTKVSSGCARCYAERIFPRVYAKSGRKFTDVKLHPDRLDKPLHWRKPRRVFVNSMSDLFHEDIGPEFCAKVFATMAQAKAHTFQVLTKRPERMRWAMETAQFWLLVNAELWKRCTPVIPGGMPCILPNVWLGVSVEDQATADERIPLLLQTPAAVRFVSYEPALGLVDFERAGGTDWWESGNVNWLIVGGESGPGARPCSLDWLRYAVQQAKRAGLPAFVKQLGSHPYDGAHCLHRKPHGGHKNCGAHWQLSKSIRHSKGGDPSEWPADLRVREWPA